MPPGKKAPPQQSSLTEMWGGRKAKRAPTEKGKPKEETNTESNSMDIDKKEDVKEEEPVAEVPKGA